MALVIQTQTVTSLAASAILSTDSNTCLGKKARHCDSFSLTPAVSMTGISPGSMTECPHGPFMAMVLVLIPRRKSVPEPFRTSLWCVSIYREEEIFPDICTQYMIANLGFSRNFAAIDLTKLTFPYTMSIDYIRVYQPKDSINIGCDPASFPTADYIETSVYIILLRFTLATKLLHSYKSVYTNPNITTWEQAGQPWPKNKLKNGGTC